MLSVIVDNFGRNMYSIVFCVFRLYLFGISAQQKITSECVKVTEFSIRVGNIVIPCFGLCHSITMLHAKMFLAPA
jgi:hypothetical protein